jgi:hypothetical protein
MPFDGRTQDHEPEIFSVEGLAAWLRTQDPATEYIFCSSRHCLAARYLVERLRVERSKVARTVSDLGKSYEAVFGGAVGYSRIAVAFPRTYGAALERCEAELRRKRVSDACFEAAFLASKVRT